MSGPSFATYNETLTIAFLAGMKAAGAFSFTARTQPPQTAGRSAGGWRRGPTERAGGGLRSQPGRRPLPTRPAAPPRAQVHSYPLGTPCYQQIQDGPLCPLNGPLICGAANFLNRSRVDQLGALLGDFKALVQAGASRNLHRIYRILE